MRYAYTGSARDNKYPINPPPLPDGIIYFDHPAVGRRPIEVLEASLQSLLRQMPKIPPFGIFLFFEIFFFD